MSAVDANPTVRHIARITLELTSPLHVGSGRAGDFSDANLVYDANGLPAIPGSSIAGVLRSFYQENPKRGEDIFGFQRRDDDARGSRLTISWAAIHDSQNRPVDGLMDLQQSSREDDPVLRIAAQPSLRDHVRITHTGVADAKGHGKFDELSLHVGHRFTFELELRGLAKDREIDAALMAELIGHLQDPRFRIGGKTRRGFGAVETVRILRASFNLALDDERQNYLRHPVSLGLDSPVMEDLQIEVRDAQRPFAELRLAADAFWMFGGGTDINKDGKPFWKAADMAPVRDSVIIWGEGKASILEDCFMIPASSIKGSIAHRTAFHYNCLEGRTVDPDAADAHEKFAEFTDSNKAISALFGDAKEGESGQRGHVIINDSFLKPDDVIGTQEIHHVSIDRFTGGALDGALFDERPVMGGTLYLRVILGKSEEELESTCPNCVKALRQTLVDLAEGRLSLGAGGGRGNGFFKGDLDFADLKPETVTA